MGWIMDFCAQSLRNIIIGIGGRQTGFMMQSKFRIAVGSECMAILFRCNDLADRKQRLNNITVAFDKSGKPVTTGRSRSRNAMPPLCAIPFNPTLMCTAEYNPLLCPCRTIRQHRSGSVLHYRRPRRPEIIRLPCHGVRVCSRHRFGEFWNVKSRFSGLKPHVSVLTTTVRAPEDARRRAEGRGRQGLARRIHKGKHRSRRKGLHKYGHMINVIRKSGINPVVCIKPFLYR